MGYLMSVLGLGGLTIMAKIDQYRGRVFNSSCFEEIPFEERLLLRDAIHETLLPKFASGVFQTVAAKYYNAGAHGLTANFGKVSLCADGCAGRFLVTLSRGNSMITFGSCTEKPFNHFRNPSLTSYSGKPEDWSLMIDQVAQGLKRAQRRGSKPLIEYSVLARMYGG